MSGNDDFMLQWMTTEVPLSQDERDLRDLFVSEYMKDFDVFYATIRTGFQPVFALEWGKRLFQCPYVQRALSNLKRKPTVDDEATLKAQHEANLLYLCFNGSEASRVAASKAYAEFKGWAKPEVADDAADKLTEVLRDFAAKAPL
jgi:hypothetical protein